MRKFVRKNRPKRKYTKKTEITSISPASKTAYGMLPIMIMIIAFMTTMIISLPFRDAFSHIRIIFQVPEFSLSNPLIFFQILAEDIRQLSLALVATLSFIFASCAVFFANAENATVRSATLLNPLPLVFFINNSLNSLGLAILTFFLAIGQGIAFIFNAVLQSILLVSSAIQTAVVTVFSFINTMIISIGQVGFSLVLNVWHVITAVATFIWQILVTVTLVITHAIVFALSFIIHSIVILVETLGRWFVTISVAIITAIDNFFAAVLRVIEIPFKLLHAFWLLIKPYVDIFGHHVALVGNDFDNGLISLVKMPALLNAPR